MTGWFTVAIIARFILGSSAIADKWLLEKHYPNPVGYVFWLGIVGLSALLLIPFGFRGLPIGAVLVAVAAGALFALAMLFYFLSLSRCEASKILIFIAALAPIFTFAFASWILGSRLTSGELFAFFVLVAGGLVLFFAEERHLRVRMFSLATASAILFGISNVLTKQTFLTANFVTGFVWIKVGAAAAVLFLLIFFPQVRRAVINPPEESGFRNKAGYFLNRAYAGAGSVLVAYAILLGPPSLVDATANFQYVFIFLGSWLILKEYFKGTVLRLKLLALFLISLGIFWLGATNYLKNTVPNPARPIVWGATFSQKFAESMGLDWKKTYHDILYDLGAKNVRLIAYWDKIEPANGRFEFSDLDYQMKSAEEAGAKVILAVGQKVPRWPECHNPGWTNELSRKDLKDKALDFVKKVVLRYRGSPALEYWQVENEIFLPFGICPRLERGLLDEEIKTVKGLDPGREIVVNDSGELGIWLLAARRGDIFGTTIYRRVRNRLFGEIEYPLPPEFFRLKEAFSRFITRDYARKYIVVELGAEPWLEEPLSKADLSAQFRVFDLRFFKDTVRYAKAAGFDEYYLWGAEWWYWLKEKQGHPEFWEFAKTLIRGKAR